jgi:putative oxidoreductase
MNPLRFVARAMLAALYIDSGLRSYRHPDRLAEQAKNVTDRVAPLISAIHPALPTDARTLVKVNGAAQVVGGVLLATGKAARPGALLLAGSLVPTTLAGHPYWQIEDPTQRAQQRIHFLKNLSMLGGLLITAMDTAGQPGLAWRTGDLARKAKRSARHAARDTQRSVERAAHDVSAAATSAASSAKLAAASAKAKAADLTGS